MTRAFILLQRMLPQHLLSRIVGFVANSRISIIKNTFIRVFLFAYDVNLNEAANTEIDDYETFNAFFTRRLKPGARPIEGAISSPADGTVSQAGPIEGTQLFQAKGLTYSLAKLLGGTDHDAFANGAFATIYLAPKDYHRVHVPIAGKLVRARYIPGKLFSVNQSTAALVPDLFADNERLACWFETETGPVGVVMVGAMIVAGIKPVWRDSPYPPRLHATETFETPIAFEQGAELGCFEMGSTVIVLTTKRHDWRVGAGEPVRMGQAIQAT